MTVVLAIVTPYDTVSQTRKTIRVCSTSDRDFTSISNQRWWPAILDSGMPKLGMILFDGNFSSNVEPGGASIELTAGELKKLDTNALKYEWGGASLTLYAGETAASLPGDILFYGKIESYENDSGKFKLTATVDQEPFAIDVLDSYAGTTGIEGHAELKGTPKPWLLGEVQNCEPVQIDTIDNVFQFSAYGPIKAVDKLYERGSEFTASVGDYASLAALIAADIKPGKWGTCLALGLVRLGAPPYGVITGDVRGDAPSGTLISLTGAIISRVAAARSIDSGKINATSLAALDVAVPYAIGIYLTQQETVLSFARRIARGCNAQCGVSWTGELFCIRPTIGIPSLNLSAAGDYYPPVSKMIERETSPPYKRIELIAARNWRVHDLDEISYDLNLIDRGLYDNVTVYREGNIVELINRERFLYINAAPTAGNAPPNATYWVQLNGPIDMSGISAISVFPNTNFKLLAADGRPVGCYAGYSNTDPATIKVSPNGGVRLDPGADTTTGIFFAAMPIFDENQYRIDLRLLFAAASASGLTIRIAEYAGNLPAGAKYVVQNAQTNEGSAVNSTNWQTFADDVAAPNSETDYELIYTPNTGTKWASVYLLNLAGAGTAWLDVRRLSVTPRSTYGATGAQITAIALAQSTADTAAATADGKITVFKQSATPTSEGVGDLWFKSSTNKWYIAESIGADAITAGEWVLAEDASIGVAILAAAGAQSTADGKVKTFYQTSAPTAEGIGDLWVDTDETPVTVYRWSGSAWQIISTVGATSAQLTSIATAQTAANTAQATADGKIALFQQSGIPVSEGVGDLWWRTSTSKWYRAESAGADAITAGEWVLTEDFAIGTAILAAAGAQSTADGKVATFYAAGPPTAEGVGDLWVETDQTPFKIHRWNGSAWQQVMQGDVTLDQFGALGPNLVADEYQIFTEDNYPPVAVSSGLTAPAATAAKNPLINLDAYRVAIANGTAANNKYVTMGPVLIDSGNHFLPGGKKYYVYGYFGMALAGNSRKIRIGVQSKDNSFTQYSSYTLGEVTAPRSILFELDLTAQPGQGYDFFYHMVTENGSAYGTPGGDFWPHYQGIYEKTGTLLTIPTPEIRNFISRIIMSTVEKYADQTAIIEGASTIYVKRDADLDPKVGELPKTVALKLNTSRQGDVTSQAAWAIESDPSAWTASIGAATGIYTVTDPDDVPGKAVLTATWNGKTYKKTVELSFTDDPPTAVGGAVVQDNSLASPGTNTSYVQMSDNLAIVAVDTSISLSGFCNYYNETGTAALQIKWQVSTDGGGSWADTGSAQEGGTASSGEPDGVSISVAYTATTGNGYVFRLMGRRTDGAGSPGGSGAIGLNSGIAKAVA